MATSLLQNGASAVPPARRRPWRPVAAAVLLAVLFVGVIMVSSALADIAELGRLPQLFQGRPRLANSRAGEFIVRGERMVPGHKVFGDVRVRNRGDRRGILYVRPRHRLDTPGPGGALLSPRLLLSVRRIWKDGHRSTVWRGFLSDFREKRLGTLRPGEARRYRFVVRFRSYPALASQPQDNDLMDSAYTTDFVWRLVSVR